VAQRVAELGLSVRETEKTVQDILNPKAKRSSKLKTSRDILRFEEELSEKFGTKVELKPGKRGAGKMVISYASHEHLDDLLSKFKI
jgi:ParB family chromosome partitioning protein